MLSHFLLNVRLYQQEDYSCDQQNWNQQDCQHNQETKSHHHRISFFNSRNCLRRPAFGALFLGFAAADEPPQTRSLKKIPRQ